MGERNYNFNMDNSHYGNNRARYGGAIYLNSYNMDIDFETSEFVSNHAERNGGALFSYSDNNDMDLDHLTFKENRADVNGKLEFLRQLLSPMLNYVLLFVQEELCILIFPTT